MMGHFNSIKAIAISDTISGSETRYIASASQD